MDLGRSMGEVLGYGVDAGAQLGVCIHDLFDLHTQGEIRG